MYYPKEFHRKGNSNTVDQHKLPVSVPARYFRLHPTKQHDSNCLREELYGAERELSVSVSKIRLSS